MVFLLTVNCASLSQITTLMHIWSNSQNAIVRNRGTVVQAQ